MMINMLMRIIYCNLFLLLVFTVPSAAQWSSRNEKMSFGSFDYRFEKPDTTISLPFSALLVHDIRFDTTRIGVMNTSFNGPKFIQLPGGIRNIQDYYNGLIRTSPGSRILHCFIRKLYLTDRIEAGIDDSEARLRSGDFEDLEKSGIYFTAEFYEQEQDQYRALYRFDTLIASRLKVKRKSADYLESALKASLGKISQLDLARIHERGKVLTAQAIDSFNTARLSLPVLTAPPAKGIFFTWEDFKQNRPSDLPFRIESDKKGNFLYLTNGKGGETLQRELWGISDGYDRYIYAAGNFFKLVRSGNGFTLYGAKEITPIKRWNPSVLPGTGSSGGVVYGSTGKTVYKLKKELLVLDMETGKIY
jgi:hypothetical protein